MTTVHTLIAHRPPPFLLEASFDSLEASRFLRKHHIGGAPVIDDKGDLVGFCSERDIVYRVVAEQRNPLETTVRDIMSRDVLWVGPDEPIPSCETRMREAHVRHLPVVADHKIIACLSLRDLLAEELEESETEVRCLTDYIRGAEYADAGQAGA